MFTIGAGVTFYEGVQQIKNLIEIVNDGSATSCSQALQFLRAFRGSSLCGNSLNRRVLGHYEAMWKERITDFHRSV